MKNRSKGRSYKQGLPSRQAVRKQRATESAQIQKTKMTDVRKSKTNSNISTSSFLIWAFITGIFQPITFLICAMLNMLEHNWFVTKYLPACLISTCIAVLITYPLLKVKSHWGFYYDSEVKIIFRMAVIINTFGFWLSIDIIDVFLSVFREYSELRELQR